MECRRIFFEPSCHNNMMFLGNGDSGFQVGRRALTNTDESSKRRPFFSRVEDLYDDEYLDEQLMEKKRRLTPEQVHLLEKSFEADNKLEPERKTQLARKLNIQPRQVAVWFQNRRARWKTKQLERDYDQLKSSYDSLLSNHDSMVKENDKLKSELLALTEKLQPQETTGELGQKYDLVPADAQHMVKVEDRISTGSAGSAVVDDDGRQLLDSGDSYFPNKDYPDCMAAVGGINSEEDDDGRSYFTNVFAEEQQQEPIDWCIWS